MPIESGRTYHLRLVVILSYPLTIRCVIYDLYFSWFRISMIHDTLSVTSRSKMVIPCKTKSNKRFMTSSLQLQKIFMMDLITKNLSVFLVIVYNQANENNFWLTVIMIMFTRILFCSDEMSFNITYSGQWSGICLHTLYRAQQSKSPSVLQCNLANLVPTPNRLCVLCSYSCWWRIDENWSKCWSLMRMLCWKIPSPKLFFL